MLGDVRSRLRFFLAALGCAVLVTSFVSWAHSLHAAAGRYTWVRADPARVPSAETAELWHVSGSCVRPYLVKAVLRSKAKLEAHYNAAPVEVRARLNARPDPAQSVKPAAWHPPADGGQEQTARNDPYGEYVAALQVKYAEWYAALFKLEIEAGSWQQRLLDVADQTVVLSAATRASFAAYSRGGGKLTGSQGDFDGYLLTTLGLGGFSSDEQMSLKSACVTIRPVIESFYDPNLLGALWHWPLDCLTEFSFGLELVLIAIFFAPIVRWMQTGDVDAVGLAFRALTRRRAISIRDFDESKLIGAALERVRQMRVAVLAAPDRIKSYAANRASAATAGPAKPERSGPKPPATPPIGPAPPAIKAAIRPD
jgi:hypothetical protein